jgi:hypothetical protein
MHSSPPAGLLMQPSNYARGLTARPTPARQSELEDLCFAVLQPAEYRALRRGLDALWGLSSLPAGAGEGAPADAPPAAAGARGGGGPRVGGLLFFVFFFFFVMGRVCGRARRAAGAGRRCGLASVARAGGCSCEPRCGRGIDEG